MELRIALPIARIYHARGFTQTQIETQLMLDGAEPWVARFAARNAALLPHRTEQLTTAEQLARPTTVGPRPDMTTTTHRRCAQ